jgi:hypothetical protein
MKPLLAMNHRDEYQDLQHEEETDGALVRLKKHVAHLQLGQSVSPRWILAMEEHHY